MMTIFSLASVFMGTFAWFIANRNVANTADSFVSDEISTDVNNIRIHKYIGESTVENGETYFGFDPEPYADISFTNGQIDEENLDPETPMTITLDKYSSADPHHPVLILFGVTGTVECIKAKTSYPFLAHQKAEFGGTLPETNIVNSRLGLNAKAADASVGEFFEVTHDESQNGEDENENKITTRYKYLGNNQFELVWVDLALKYNPLSSVIRTFSFEYEDEPEVTTHDLYLYDEDGERALEPTADKSCIAIKESECVTDAEDEDYNMGSFVSFSTDNQVL